MVRTRRWILAGSVAAATASVLSGPSETIVIESAGLDRRRSSIISELGLTLGVKNLGGGCVPSSNDDHVCTAER